MRRGGATSGDVVHLGEPERIGPLLVPHWVFVHLEGPPSARVAGLPTGASAGSLPRRAAAVLAAALLAAAVGCAAGPAGLKEGDVVEVVGAERGEPAAAALTSERWVVVARFEPEAGADAPLLVLPLPADGPDQVVRTISCVAGPSARITVRADPERGRVLVVEGAGAEPVELRLVVERPLSGPSQGSSLAGAPDFGHAAEQVALRERLAALPPHLPAREWVAAAAADGLAARLGLGLELEPDGAARLCTWPELRLPGADGAGPVWTPFDPAAARLGLPEGRVRLGHSLAHAERDGRPLELPATYRLERTR